MELIFASQNEGKIKEVQKIFEDKNIKILSLKDIGFVKEIVEDSDTFEGNAFIKAKTIYEKYKLPVIADDSGLEVLQLNNRPGVFSARYAGEDATYKENNIKLLGELDKYPQPHKAQFVCCAVYLDSEKKISQFGKLEGEIIKEFKGENGFGYDPIFKPDGYEITLAEMSLKEKNRISHRANAFNLLKNKIFA
ncbi:MAG: non-canonical purine NTP pyrophosphatase, RdgB/HAM1 family [Ignavibacteriae bacterium]|nr:MAG: non-canonical purine NTP pyrophosphatase, RdgB/HAM1 family [Ignavibacteriota bacterium]